MPHLTTSAQVQARQSLSPDQQLMFDAEFERRKIRRLWITVWYFLFGFFGGHLIYLALKGSSTSQYWGWYFIVYWIVALSLGRLDHAAIALLIGFAQYLYLVGSSAVDSENDTIAMILTYELKR